jgi:hypothetical protein
LNKPAATRFALAPGFHIPRLVVIERQSFAGLPPIAKARSTRYTAEASIVTRKKTWSFNDKNELFVVARDHVINFSVQAP